MTIPGTHRPYDEELLALRDSGLSLREICSKLNLGYGKVRTRLMFLDNKLNWEQTPREEILLSSKAARDRARIESSYVDIAARNLRCSQMRKLGMTLTDIAKVENLSHEGVRQILINRNEHKLTKPRHRKARNI